MLSISNVETFYGNIQALRGVNVKVNSGEIVSLINLRGSKNWGKVMYFCLKSMS